MCSPGKERLHLNESLRMTVVSMKSGFHLLHRREVVGRSRPHEHLRPSQLSTGCSVKVCKDQQMMAISPGAGMDQATGLPICRLPTVVARAKKDLARIHDRRIRIPVNLDQARDRPPSNQGYRDPGLHRQESHAQVLQGGMETMSNQHFLRSRCRVSRRKCKVCRAWLPTSSSCALLGSLSGTKDQCSDACMLRIH